MLPILEIFNTKIPMYSLFCILGFGLALIFSLYFAKYYKIKKQYIFYAFVYELIGAISGAKLYYILSHLNNYIEKLNNEEFLKLILPGFSFIGDLFRWNTCHFNILQGI